MARIAGVDLPKDKRTEIALRRIYGIGPTTAKKLCDEAGIPDDSRVKNLTEEQVNKLRHSIEEGYKVEGMLRSEITMNIDQEDLPSVLQISSVLYVFLSEVVITCNNFCETSIFTDGGGQLVDRGDAPSGRPSRG